MDYEKMIVKLLNSEYGDKFDTLRDALVLCRELMELEADEVIDYKGRTVFRANNPENKRKALDYALLIRRRCAKQLVKGHGEGWEWLYWETLKFAAPYDFDCFCRYIEKEREPSKRFYEPRRKQLLSVAKALQRLEDDELDLLAISLPPGVGKTTLAIFYICWESGLHPEKQNLIGSHNNEFLRGVYDECLRILDKNGEYLWADVFPNLSVCGTNAKDLRIDVGTRKRFQTIEMSSISSGNAGKIRATNLLYCDDLCEGIEQAMNPDQMNKLWQKYTVDLRQRMQGTGVKELHIQTRWSINDVVGRLQELYGDSDRALFINIPALDENGESNFDYPYGVGFSKEMYNDLEASMDEASWKALYLGEPIEREGQLYESDELRRYYELPEGEPDAIIAVCDTKEQGDDFCVMPVVYKYGNDYYIDKFICDNGKPDIIEKRVVEVLALNEVQEVRFEGNRGGTIFAENVQNGLKAKGSRCHVTTKWNQTNKETRIVLASSWVKQHCLFKAESLYAGKGKGVLDREYRTAMGFLTGYTMKGRNKHDDVPDAMADLENFTKSFSVSKIEVRKRQF